MPITIASSPEPMSERSFSLLSSAEAILADSDACRLLREDLRRYCIGEVRGRSFLVAGHRGAGKTTLVNNAILEVWRESERGTLPLRPLFVALHGPNLFPPLPARAPGKRVPGPVLATAAGEPPQAAKSEAQIALEQITLGLHRAVAREFIQRFWACAERSSRPARGTPSQAELAAQFEIELYEGPSPARLREFWTRVGAMESGLLNLRGVPPRLPDEVSPDPQAARELTALSCMVEAYRRISGDYKRSEKSDEKRARAAHVGLSGELGKEVAKPLSAVAAGLLTGAGVLSVAASPFAAVSSGLVAALGSAAVFKFSASRTRERSQSREDSFIFDLSVATLDRILPTLVERLRRAGLAPIFVVDELDKVEGLSSRIIAMVHHLKKLVAENAFFCFLTDRGYFEDLRLSGQQRAYDVAYSYFSQRLLVALSPDELDVYLSRLFTTTGTPGTPASSPSASPSQRQADDDIDRELLPWVLRQRAALHPLALQREIAAIRDGDQVRLRPGEVRSRKSFLIDVTLQMGIEFTLAQPTVQSWLAQRPEMRQVLFDALYFVSRSWREESAELDLSCRGRSGFLQKLNARMNLRDTRAAGTAETPAISEIDADFLFSWAQWLATFLAHERLPVMPDWRPEQLTQWARPGTGTPGAIPPRARPVAQSVLDALLLGHYQTLLVPHPDEEHRYTWRYWSSGDLRPVDPPPFGLYWLNVETSFLAAVEYMLALPEVFALGPDRLFARALLRDALCHPLRQWREGHMQLALTSTGRSTFKADLLARGASLAAACGQPAPELSEARVDALFELLGELVTLLACEDAPPDSPAGRFGDWVAGTAGGRRPLVKEVQDRLLIGTPRNLLQPAPGRAQVYRFRYDRDGNYRVPEDRRLESAAAHVDHDHASGWRRDAEFIAAMDKRLSGLLGSGPEAGRGGVFNVLAEQYRVLPTTPAWSYVVSALVRLEQNQQRGIAPGAEDVAVVQGFRAMLDANRQVLAEALVCASFLAAASAVREPPQRLREALWALSRGLRFGERSTAEVSTQLRSLAYRIGELFDPKRGDLLQGLEQGQSLASFWAALKACIERTAGLAPRMDSPAWAGVIERAWRECRQRLLAWFKREAREVLELHELLCLATSSGPALRIEPEVERMRLMQWSDALYEALQAAAPDPVHDTPRWLALFALRGLSFAGLGTPASGPLITVLAERDSMLEGELHGLADDLRFNGQYSPGTLLLVRRAQRSTMESWIPENGVFCLTLTHWQLDMLLAKGPGGFLSVLPQPRRLIWEQPSDSPTSEQSLGTALARLWTGPDDLPFNVFGLYAEQPRDKPAYSPVVAARGPGDVLSATYSR